MGVYDEHGKPEQLNASADAFGAPVRVAGLIAVEVGENVRPGQPILMVEAAGKQ